MQKYSLNENYFSVIDDEHKAYWLGFIYADGSLIKTTQQSSGKNRLQLMLSKADMCLLEAFKQDLQYSGPIYVKNYNNTYNKNGIDCCYLQINSRPMCIDLENLGMYLKEQRCSIPQISKHLVRHFIRGYFDGDGCISVFECDSKGRYNTYHRKCREFSITSQESILLEFKKIFEDECNVSKNVSIKRYKRTQKAVSLRYGGKEDVISLFHYLYNDATIYLDRKYNNFQKVLLQ